MNSFLLIKLYEKGVRKIIKKEVGLNENVVTTIWDFSLLNVAWF